MRLRTELVRKDLEISLRAQVYADEDTAMPVVHPPVVETIHMKPQPSNLDEQINTTEDGKEAAEPEEETLRVQLENLRRSDLAVRLELKRAQRAMTAQGVQMEELQQKKLVLEQAVQRHSDKYAEAQTEIAVLCDVVTRLKHKIEMEMDSARTKQLASLHSQNTAVIKRNMWLEDEVGKLRTTTAVLLQDVAKHQASEASLMAQIASNLAERARLIANNAELYKQIVGREE